MLNNAIACVSELGCQQGMPKSLTFADRYGHEIHHGDGGVDDKHDSTYDPADDDDSVSTNSSTSYDSDDDDGDDDDDDDNDSQPLPALTAGVDDMTMMRTMMTTRTAMTIPREAMMMRTAMTIPKEAMMDLLPHLTITP
jgi:hypothetical protein